MIACQPYIEGGRHERKRFSQMAHQLRAEPARTWRQDGRHPHDDPELGGTGRRTIDHSGERREDMGPASAAGRTATRAGDADLCGWADDAVLAGTAARGDDAARIPSVERGGSLSRPDARGSSPVLQS